MPKGQPVSRTQKAEAASGELILRRIRNKEAGKTILWILSLIAIGVGLFLLAAPK